MAGQEAGRQIRISGIVQGVGFRPFVYELATRYDLSGWVRNDAAGVEIAISGEVTALETFIAALQTNAPPLAVIDSLQVEPGPVQSGPFQIRHSRDRADAFVPVSPDVSVCVDCLRELFDPTDRRYRYPFINCTNCGPRFTIIRRIPYDRPYTTMAPFQLCSRCRAEYEDPTNRRFHAQPNACPVCGPQLAFQWSPQADMTAFKIRGNDPLGLAQQVIAQGGIVAIKGLGGFHLACDARNTAALATLRRRKGRVDKPFALMALDLTGITGYAQVGPAEETLLQGRERPIVLLPKKSPPLILPHEEELGGDRGGQISNLVAPGNHFIGVMLPYTPLHYLLLSPHPDDPHPVANPIVLTSGNLSEEPIVKDNYAALDRLAPLADAFLLHNREIHIHCDDSVIRVFAGHELPVRRSRGYAPFPVRLPFPVRQVLAVGGELKNTFCLTKDHYAFMSQHIGDMENLETVQAFERAAGHMQTLFRVTPELLAHDLHPGYLSTKWAREHQETFPKQVAVQHHHAHLAAVMAEHGLLADEQVIGFSFDGTGYGPDGAIWGGELLLAGYQTFERLGHLKYVPLPGGDAAIKRPYRTALAYLWAAGIDWKPSLAPLAACPMVEQGVIRRQLERGLNAPLTSSMGRLFDAVAALLGLRQTVTYEAQAAIELEAIVDQAERGAYRFDLVWEARPVVYDPEPVLHQIVTDLAAGEPVGRIAARFHRAVAGLVLELALWLHAKQHLNRVALSGGVFQNITLLTMTVDLLQAHDFQVLTHRRVPPNDGGLALGQALIAHFATNV